MNEGLWWLKGNKVMLDKLLELENVLSCWQLVAHFQKFIKLIASTDQKTLFGYLQKLKDLKQKLMSQLALIHLNFSFTMLYQANFQKVHLNNTQQEINVKGQAKN